MSPAEIAKLAALIDSSISLPDGLGDGLAEKLAALLADRYVIFERTQPRRFYCEECGFSGGAAGHHPRCTRFDRYRRLGT